MALTKVQAGLIEATGTPSSTTFLRGDGAWTAPTSGITSGTAVASTSGTSIDFTGIPAGVKRITVVFNGVSTTGTSNYLIQIGAGSVTSTGYLAYSTYAGGANAAAGVSSTAGYIINGASAANLWYGTMVLVNISGNIWVASHSFGLTTTGPTIYGVTGGGSVSLSGTLDRVRLTTVNGTDAFDAGSINILYES